MQPILFLDLDETLVHSLPGTPLRVKRKLNTEFLWALADQHPSVGSIKTDLKRFDQFPRVTVDGHPFVVNTRPYLYTFLNQCVNRADLYVFSAGSPDYVSEVLRETRVYPYLSGWFSSQVQNDFTFAQGRHWVLLDNLPFKSDPVHKKLQQITPSPTPSQHVKIEPYFGGIDNNLVQKLPELLRRIKAMG